MIIAVDVHYREDLAKTVSIEFAAWDDEKPSKINNIDSSISDDYQPGEFYKRELPCIREVLKLTDLNNCEAIIIDGYVILNDEGKHGLGGYLYESLENKIPVIGVAKKRFHANKKNVAEVIRGESKNPLFVTCKGMELKMAAEKIEKMKGPYRIPSLLKILDQKTKENKSNPDVS